MGNVLILPLALALLAALPPSALAAGTRGFDPARIHADYQAGEFEKVIRALEAFRDSGRRCRKADSVFLEKHLAVVYAADPKTRERGRYHMLRMLALDPEADLLDMFVGEAVDGIFEKVSKENRIRLQSLAKARPAAPAAIVPRPAFPEPGPAPRLKPWNLDDTPAPHRLPRKPGASRAATAREADAAPRPAGKPVIQPARLTPIEFSEAGTPPDSAGPEASPKPPWKEKGFWVGGTAVAAVLGLTAYYVGSQDWSEPASKNRTYGVAAKPNGN